MGSYIEIKIHFFHLINIRNWKLKVCNFTLQNQIKYCKIKNNIGNYLDLWIPILVIIITKPLQKNIKQR